MMKILISEKQFKKIIDTVSETELDEQDGSGPIVDPIPKSGTSEKQSGGQGYPEVSTWEKTVGSKLTRGAANQIKNTKWSETVGSLLKRDAANQLK
jgi:hypothetical protein